MTACGGNLIDFLQSPQGAICTVCSRDYAGDRIDDATIIESVSAKRAQVPLQGICATIERTGKKSMTACGGNLIDFLESLQGSKLHSVELRPLRLRKGATVPATYPVSRIEKMPE